MKKRMKSLLSLLLVLTMLVGMVAVPVYAEEGVYESNLSAYVFMVYTGEKPLKDGGLINGYDTSDSFKKFGIDEENDLGLLPDEQFISDINTELTYDKKKNYLDGWALWGIHTVRVGDGESTTSYLHNHNTTGEMTQKKIAGYYQEKDCDCDPIVFVPVYKPIHQINPQPTAESPEVGAQQFADGTWQEPEVDVEYQWYKQETFVIGDKEADDMLQGLAIDIKTTDGGENTVTVGTVGKFDNDDAWKFNGDSAMFFFPASYESDNAKEIVDKIVNSDDIVNGDEGSNTEGLIDFLSESTYLHKDDIVTINCDSDAVMGMIIAIPKDFDLESVIDSELDVLVDAGGTLYFTTEFPYELKMPFDGYVEIMLEFTDAPYTEELKPYPPEEDPELPEDDTVSVKVTVERATPIDGETEAKLSSGEDGVEYFCRVTFDPNGATRTVIDSESFIYVAPKISDEENIRVNDNLDRFKADLGIVLNRQFDITASASEGGTISPAGVTKARFNSLVKYTITPDEGMVIADVIVDGKSVGAVSTYTFAQIGSNHTISVVFEEADEAIADSEVTE